MVESGNRKTKLIDKETCPHGGHWECAFTEEATDDDKIYGYLYCKRCTYTRIVFWIKGRKMPHE